MNNQEKLIKGVLNGELSVINGLMSENVDVSINGREALREAKIKLYQAKSKFIEAESIVSILEIGSAANERCEIREEINKKMPLCKVVDKMSCGNDEARKILSEIVNRKKTVLNISEELEKGEQEGEKILADIVNRQKYSSSQRIGYIFEMNELKIRGERIVWAYEFCGRNIFNMFEVLDYETYKLMSHLEELSTKGDSENG